jgi:hypothetical protein
MVRTQVPFVLRRSGEPRARGPGHFSRTYIASVDEDWHSLMLPPSEFSAVAGRLPIPKNASAGDAHLRFAAVFEPVNR